MSRDCGEGGVPSNRINTDIGGEVQTEIGGGWGWGMNGGFLLLLFFCAS